MKMSKGRPKEPGAYLIRWINPKDSGAVYKIVVVDSKYGDMMLIPVATTHHIRLSDIEHSLED